VVCNHGVVGSNPIRSISMRDILMVTLAITAGACAKRAERAGTRVPGDSSAGTLAADSVPAVFPISAAPPQAALGHLMVGIWEISPNGVGGPHLSITVQSANGANFQGRISRALAGDVLLDEERFQPFTGTIGADSVARFTVGWKAKEGPPAEFAGKVSGGEWRLSRFVWGGEQQVRPGRTWTGRKAR
jgi:hypothetical protein